MQFNLLKRRFNDAGFEPRVALVLFAIGFVYLSNYLFSKTDAAPYFYVLLATLLLLSLSEFRRNDFLKTHFSQNELIRIRQLENGIVALPFVLFLLATCHFWSAFLVIGIAFLMTFFVNRPRFHVTLPTPFSRKPFEFTVGFRATWMLVLAALVLEVIAIAVSNAQLGIAAMMSVIVLTLNFYKTPEDAYYVWNFNRTPYQFLIYKITYAWRHVSVLVLPFVVLNGIFFWEQIGYTLLFLGMGFLVQLLIVLAKYVDYPNEIGLITTLLIIVSIFFPLLLLFTIPFFFVQGIQRLNPYLK